jgi:hypothetical protein
VKLAQAMAFSKSGGISGLMLFSEEKGFAVWFKRTLFSSLFEWVGGWVGYKMRVQVRNKTLSFSKSPL